MLKFEEARTEFHSLASPKFKKHIPIVAVKPKNINDKSVVFIFNGGIGNSIPTSLFLNNPAYDNHYFVTYDKAGHNENKNKASQFKKLWLTELDEVVNWCLAQYPNRKIYLLGESWGTAINFIYYGKNQNKIAGTVGWNMPLKIANPEKMTKKQLFKIAIMELTTLLTNVELHLPKVQGSQERFSRDTLFARLLNLVPPSKTNTRINLAVWRFMRPTRSFFKKHGKDSSFNFLYIQSGEDVMANWKALKKSEKYLDQQHYIKFPTGYHVLSLEPKESIDLYNAISEFIKK